MDFAVAEGSERNWVRIAGEQLGSSDQSVRTMDQEHARAAVPCRFDRGQPASRQPAETEGRLAGVDEHITSAQIRRLTVRREQGVEGGKGHEENPCGGPDFRIKPRHRARLALRSSAPGFSRAWSGFI